MAASLNEEKTYSYVAWLAGIPLGPIAPVIVWLTAADRLWVSTRKEAQIATVFFAILWASWTTAFIYFVVARKPESIPQGMWVLAALVAAINVTVPSVRVWLLHKR